MAPFTYRNLGEVDQQWPAWRLLHGTLPTAIEETKHHRQIFASHTEIR